jgi:hypothetical protein
MSSNRSLTSDDLILPGTPLLSGTPELRRPIDFGHSLDSPQVSFEAQTSSESPDFDWLDRPYEPIPPDPSPSTIRKKSSFRNLFWKKKSSSTLRETSNSPVGFGISSEASQSMEQFPGFEQNSGAPERPSLRKKISMGFLRKSHSRTDTSRSIESPSFDQNAGAFERPSLRKKISMGFLQKSRSRTDTSRSIEQFPGFDQNADASERPSLRKKISMGLLQKPHSRTDTLRSKIKSPVFWTRRNTEANEDTESRTDDNLQSKPAGPETFTTDPRVYQLKKQKSLPAISIKNQTSSMEDLEPLFVATGDEYQRYTLLSAPEQDKEVKKARSFSTLRSAADSELSISRADHDETSSELRKLKLKLSRKELAKNSASNPPLPFELEIGNESLKPDSQKWKVDESTRQHWLETTRAERLNLSSNNDSKKLPFEYPRATPEPPPRRNFQSWNSTVPQRDGLVKPAPRKHTPISVDKYVLK